MPYMEPLIQRDFLGTMKGLADFRRFKEIYSQIEQDETALRELISSFLAKPTNQLLLQIEQTSSYLKAEVEKFNKLIRAQDIDGPIFWCAEIESRVVGLLQRAQQILEKYDVNLQNFRVDCTHLKDGF